MAFPWKQILAGAKFGAGLAANVVTGGAAGAVLTLIPDLVDTLEKAFISQPGSGMTKKELALKLSMFGIAAAEGISQKDLFENEAAMDAIDAMIEAAVAFNNAINRTPKTA